MDAETYSDIVKKLQSVIDSCKNLVSELKAVEGDVTKWTLQKYSEMRKTATVLQAKQDKILSTELYHILGMTEMTVTQSAHFVKLTKELANCRTAVKKCAGLPELKIYPIDLASENSYECKELGLILKK